MNNKLGLSDNDLEFYEDQIFDFKSSLLDEKITFNCSEFDLEYLKRLHSFLYGDLYESAGYISKRYNKSDYDMINSKIKEVVDMIFYEIDASLVLNKIYEIIDMKIFEDGNNKVVKLFFDRIINMYKSNNPDYVYELLKSSERLNQFK